MLSARPARAVRGSCTLAALLFLTACTPGPGSASGSPAGPEPEARQRAADSALYSCVLEALPAGFVVVPVRARSGRPADRGIRAERGGRGPGERFERLSIGARVVPRTDSVHVGVYAESGMHTGADGSYTLDQPPRGSVRQAAAQVQAACGDIELPPGT